MPTDTKARILAVEDNPDTQLLLRYLLRDRFELTVASHVEEALTAAEDAGYSLFLLDINLGEQRTGIDLLHLLRKHAAYTETPALALTAYAMPGDRERFVEAGFNGYVSKPFTRKDLIAAIDAALEAAAGQRGDGA